MRRILVLFESDTFGRTPGVARSVARGARAAGAEVRVQPLAETGRDDIDWADALAVGIEERGSLLPYEAKRWLDALGFAGWRALRDKPACVFAMAAEGVVEAPAASRMVGRILEARGMAAFTPGQVGAGEAGAGVDGVAFGRALGHRLLRRDPPATVRSRHAG